MAVVSPSHYLMGEAASGWLALGSPHHLSQEEGPVPELDPLPQLSPTPHMPIIFISLPASSPKVLTADPAHAPLSSAGSPR